MSEKTIIALETFDVHDENAKIKGFLEKKSIAIVHQNDESIRHYFPRTPYLEFNIYDKQASELNGRALMETIAEIPIPKDYEKLILEHFKDMKTHKVITLLKYVCPMCGYIFDDIDGALNCCAGME